MAGQIVIDLHKAHSNQAVEPCVGNLLDDVLIGRLIVCILLFGPDQFDEMVTLADCFPADRIGLCRPDVIELRLAGRLRKRLMNAVRSDSHKTCTVADISNQFISRPDGEVLYGGFVHSYAVPLFIRIPRLEYRFL